MKTRRRIILLLSALVFALTGAGAATLRFMSHSSRALTVDKVSSTNPNSGDRQNSVATQRAPVTPQSIGALDPHVIAGGGGTSSGGSLTVTGTIGELSASQPMSGGSITVTGGFWPSTTAASAATPTPTPASSPTPTPTPTPIPPADVFQFSAANYSVQEDCTTVTITVNRAGDISGTASVDYSTSDVTATERKDYITALGRLSFGIGETSKSFLVLINEDSFVEGNETFDVNLSNPSGATLGTPVIATVTIIDDAAEPSANPIDDPQTYVCQHYHDFLNRQPDASGLAFWTNEITSCGTDAQCVEIKRINVSAAFYLSIEFQQTGYLVERLYKSAYGSAPGTSTFGGTHQLPVPVVRLNEFLSDTQKIGLGVVVGQGNWEQILENNKQAFTAEFVQRTRFTTAFPSSLTPAQFVDTLNSNAGNPLSPAERDQLVSDLANGVKTRAQVLRAVAEDADLLNAESNRAFVLMQYFGYLRRNPNDPQDTDYTGFDFWLTKLNQFNGNFINAEMVKAFITSGEYRQRFGP
jgi:Calx-beta domain